MPKTKKPKTKKLKKKAVKRLFDNEVPLLEILKKTTLSVIREIAWDIFSIYIRKKYADINENCKCVTCGTVKHWKEMQAGHFIDGRTNSILFDERGVFPQCYRCNCILSGNKIEYFKFMQDYYSDEVIDELRALRLQTKKYSAQDYLDLIKKYGT